MVILNNKTKPLIITLSISLVLTIAAAIISIYAYGESLLNVYTQMAKRIANYAATIVQSNEHIRDYAVLTYEYNHGNATEEEIQTVIDSPEYQQTMCMLNNLRQQMYINGIYVGAVDLDLMKVDDETAKRGYETREWRPLCYIFDVFYDESMRFSFGESSRFMPQYRAIILEACQRLDIINSQIVSSGDFGRNITSILPLYKNADIALCVGIEIPMSLVESNQSVYSAAIMTAMGIVFVIILLLVMIIITVAMLNPVTTATTQKPWTPSTTPSWTYSYKLSGETPRQTEIKRLEEMHGLNGLDDELLRDESE